MPDRSTAETSALTCFTLFILSVLLMPFLNDAYDPLDQTISEGVLGAYGFVQVAGLLVLAAGSFALAYGLRALRPPAASLPVIALISFSGACVVAVAAFPTGHEGEPATWIGQVHSSAATLAFICNVGAMLLAARVFRDDRRLAPLAGMSLFAGVSALLLLVLLGAGIEPRGLSQRAAVASIQLWMMAVALRLRAEPPVITRATSANT